MRVLEVMTREVRLCSPNDTISDAARLMADLDVGSLPVGENDRLVGIITDRDIAIRAIARGLGPDSTVADVMSPEVKYCFDDDDAEDVAHNMGDIQVRRLPVLNHDKRLVGIVSLGDLAVNLGADGEADCIGDSLAGISRPGGKHTQLHA